MEYYLEYKEEFELFLLNKKVITSGLSKKAIEKVLEIPEDEPIIDINRLDDYKLEEMELLHHNIVEYEGYQKSLKRK